MSTENVALGFGGLTAPAGTHIGYPYQSEEERFNNLLDFVATGLRNGERCVAAISEYTPGLWMDGLRSQGIEASNLPDGQLEIITAGSYARNSVAESVQTAIHLLGNSLGKSVSGQWPRVRACTSFTHLYHHERASFDLLAAESETNDVARDAKMVILCTFSRAIMHPLLVEAALNSHPFVTDGSSVTENSSFIPPHVFAPKLPEMIRRLCESGAFVTPHARLDFHGSTPVLRACRELDFYTSPRLEELANMLVTANHRRLVVDLSATTYLDASTIGVLLRVSRAMEHKGGLLALYDPMDPVRKIFQLINLGDYIPIHRSLDSAIADERMAAAA